jgi:hypothetical protein
MQPTQPTVPMQPGAQPPLPGTPGGGRKKIILIMLAVLLVGLVVLAVLLMRGNKDDTVTNASSKKPVSEHQDKDKKAAAGASDSKKNASTTTDSLAATGDKPSDLNTCSPTISQEKKDVIAAAVKARTYSTLQSMMTDPVDLVISGSNASGEASPEVAVDEMRFLNGVTDPWDFALSPYVTNVWAAHEYRLYFIDSFFAGRAASDEVVSFGFNECGKIETIFMISDYRDLES